MRIHFKSSGQNQKQPKVMFYLTGFYKMDKDTKDKREEVTIMDRQFGYFLAPRHELLINLCSDPHSKHHTAQQWGACPLPSFVREGETVLHC